MPKPLPPVERITKRIEADNPLVGSGKTRGTLIIRVDKNGKVTESRV